MRKRLFSVSDQYLQTIYSMLENQKTVKAVKLSGHFESSPSTVHATLTRMQRDELIYLDVKKNILLTNRGAERAIRLARRRRLVEKLLCEKLGIPLKEAEKHVSPLIQNLTPLIEEKLVEYLGDPKLCPHGKPIPYDQLCKPAKKRPFSR